MSDSESSTQKTPPKKRKVKYHTSFDLNWLNDPQLSSWIKKHDDFTADCKLCKTDISVKYEGKIAFFLCKSIHE